MTLGVLFSGEHLQGFRLSALRRLCLLEVFGAQQSSVSVRPDRSPPTRIVGETQRQALCLRYYRGTGEDTKQRRDEGPPGTGEGQEHQPRARVKDLGTRKGPGPEGSEGPSPDISSRKERKDIQTPKDSGHQKSTGFYCAEGFELRTRRVVSATQDNGREKSTTVNNKRP